MPDHPRISVVIPHLNDARALETTLRALAAQRDAATFEVIVVDNGSAEMPQDACAAFPGARLLLETATGPGPARSRGAAAAAGDLLAFVDADCVPAPGWIATIVRVFDDPAMQVIGGDVRIAPVDPARLTVIEAYESVFGYRMKMYIERDRYTATCNMAMRRPIFEAVGPFAGIGIAEDMDWGWRATDMGYRLTYVPELRVSTPARRSFAELARKWDRHLAHFYAQNRTRPLAGPRWLARTAAMVASPIAEVPRILGSDRLGSAADRCRALLGVTRLRFYRARQMLRLALGTDPAHMSRAWRRN